MSVDRPDSAPGSTALGWLDERYQLSDLFKFLGHKSVPLGHHHVWYYFGGVSLFLFSVQVVTGILLLLYYRPSAENAFESVQFIVTEVEFGWLIELIDLTVDPRAHKALGLQVGHELYMFALAFGYHRREQHEFAALR